MRSASKMKRPRAQISSRHGQAGGTEGGPDRSRAHQGGTILEVVSEDSSKRPSRREFGLVMAAAGAVACMPVRSVTLPTNLPNKGSRKPELVVEEVGDYQCPFCAEVQPAVKALMASHGSQIALVWRNYPLRRHEFAAMAAEAALEVRAQRGDEVFWRYHDVLFQNQHALAQPDLERYAKAVGADPTRLAEALSVGVHRGAVEDDLRYINGLKLPQFGTPAFLMGEDVFIGSYSHRELVALVEEKI